MTTPLKKALAVFTSVDAPNTYHDVVRDEQTKPVVVFFHDKDDEPSATRLLVPLVFLLRNRTDLVLVQSPETGVVPTLVVYRAGEKVATLAANEDESLKDRALALVSHIGWSSDCEGEAELENYLSPIDAKELLDDVDAYTTGQRDYVANAANVSAIIWNAFVDAKRPINWAGFYFIRPLANPKETDHSRILILGPFVGKPACSRIRLQSGVCGAAVLTKNVQRIADVHQFEGHIACDGASESEIVVPVFGKEGEVIAVIDLDCPKQNGFSVEDHRTLVEVAKIISERSDWHNLTLPYTQ